MNPASASSPSERPSAPDVCLPQAYPLPAHTTRPALRTDVWKRCAACAGYYQAQLDGEYRCSRCRREGRDPVYAMAPLDGSLTVMPEAMLPAPRRPVERVHTEITPPRHAVGGA